MTLKLFKLFIIFGTIFAWLGFWLVIFYFDPDQTSFLGFLLLYLSLFTSLSGSFFLLADWVKTKFFKNQLMFYRVRSSLRHALMLSSFIIIWALLRSFGLLRWWNFVLLFLVLTVLEFFFISYQKSPRPSYGEQNFSDQGTI